jgi:hypothetical protein
MTEAPSLLSPASLQSPLVSNQPLLKDQDEHKAPMSRLSIIAIIVIRARFARFGCVITESHA